MTALQLEPSAQAPCTRTMLGSAVISGLLPGLRSVLLDSPCAYLVGSRVLRGHPANSRARRPRRPRNAGPSLPANPRSGLRSSRLPTPPGMLGPGRPPEGRGESTGLLELLTAGTSALEEAASVEPKEALASPMVAASVLEGTSW